MCLCDLNINDSAVISNVNQTGAIKRRLYDLGFTEGAKVKLLFVSPSNLIKAYLIRDSLIAIRDSDANKIEVSGIDE